MTYKTSGIVGTFNLANSQEIHDGVSWYMNAYEIAERISIDTGIPTIVVCGVLAAISPNNKWPKNCANAEAMCAVFAAGGDPMSVKISCYNTMKQKATDILTMQQYAEDMGNCDVTFDQIMAILNGRKIQCFFACIYGHDTNKDIVCIDGHARNIVYKERISLHDSKLTIGVKEYRNLTGCYIAATKRINKENNTSYLPYQIQAITWCAWRRLHGIK